MDSNLPSTGACSRCGSSDSMCTCQARCPRASSEPEFLTVTECAAMLGVTLRVMRYAINAGRVASTRAGRLFLIRRSDALALRTFGIPRDPRGVKREQVAVSAPVYRHFKTSLAATNHEPLASGERWPKDDSDSNDA